MRTTAADLMFLTEHEAQQVLNEQDPGYTIKLAQDNSAQVFDENGQLIMALSPKGVEFHGVR